jgi:7-carboxy-7-deazaguanine synthase
VVITGGEPAIHDLTELTQLLHEKGLRVHIETSGSFPLKGNFDWITVSPKWWKLPLPEVLEAASEFKLIVEDEQSIEKWEAQLKPYLGQQSIWLHPEWSQSSNLLVLNSISAKVKTCGKPWRAGWQLHKLYAVDALDKRSAPNVPLGGNPALGR